MAEWWEDPSEQKGCTEKEKREPDPEGEKQIVNEAEKGKAVEQIEKNREAGDVDSEVECEQTA